MAICLLVSPLGSHVSPRGVSSPVRKHNACYSPPLSPPMVSRDSVAFSSSELCAAPVSLFTRGEPRNLGLSDRRGRSLARLNVRTMYTATAIDTEERATETASPKTLYQVLGVPKNATDKDIRSAYRQLARRHHPDVVPQEQKEASTKTFLQIHGAYATLSDPCSRATYDLQLSMLAFREIGYGDGHFPKFNGNYSAASSKAYCSPRGPFSSRGRSWETDQCWC